MDPKNESLQHLLRKTYRQGITYQEYRSLINSLLSNGKTSGPIQTADYIHYTELNKVRMDRLDKTTELLPEVKMALGSLPQKLSLLILTEAWCGDAAQVLPVIQKFADDSAKITSRYIFRDEHPEVMDQFLTHGGRSIPVIIGLSEQSGELLGTWGPRPLAVQQMVMQRKLSAEPIPYDQFSVHVQKWYAKDKTISIQKEFLSTLLSWS